MCCVGVRGPEDSCEQSKLEKELHPLLMPVFHLQPYPDTKDIHTVVYQ